MMSLNDLGLYFLFLARFPSGGFLLLFLKKKFKKSYLYPVKMTTQNYILTEYQGGLPRMIGQSPAQSAGASTTNRLYSTPNGKPVCRTAYNNRLLSVIVRPLIKQQLILGSEGYGR
jgi:hypothetical protein